MLRLLQKPWAWRALACFAECLPVVAGCPSLTASSDSSPLPFHDLISPVSHPLNQSSTSILCEVVPQFLQISWVNVLLSEVSVSFIHWRCAFSTLYPGRNTAWCYWGLYHKCHTGTSWQGTGSEWWCLMASRSVFAKNSAYSWNIHEESWKLIHNDTHVNVKVCKNIHIWICK